MQIHKQTDINVYLTSEEITQILKEHVLRQLHAINHIDLLPDGKVRDAGNINIELSGEPTFTLNILDVG